MMLGYGVDLTVDQLARRLVEQHGHSVDVWTPTSDGTYDGAPYNLRKLYVYGAAVNRALPLLELNAWIALRNLRPETKAQRDRLLWRPEDYSAETVEDLSQDMEEHAPVGLQTYLKPAGAYNSVEEVFADMRRWAEAPDQSYDLVIPCTHPYYSAGAALGHPSIFFNFGNVPTTGFSWKGKLNWKWLEFSDEYLWKPRSACVLSISRFLHRQQRVELQAKGRVLHLGGDHYAWLELPLDDPRRVEARLKFRLDFGIPPRSVALGFCGRLHKDHPPYKGTAQLLELARRLRSVVGTEAVVVLCGIGSEADEEWIRGAGAAPIMNLPPKLMPDFYNALDAYVCASQWEGFNLPIVEAAWHGVPSLAYDVGAHAEHVTSLLIPAGDFDGFTAAAVRLVLDGALRQRLGHSAWQRAQRFSWDNAARQLNALLVELHGGAQ
jgi:glycosyltransferase involved in cell wall biosynthesis